jgi:hypothetical protein
MSESAALSISESNFQVTGPGVLSVSESIRRSVGRLAGVLVKKFKQAGSHEVFSGYVTSF